MISRRLVTCLIVLVLTTGTSSIIYSAESSAGKQDPGTGWQYKPKSDLQDQDRSFSPAEPSGEQDNRYFILDPDGKTPSDYQRFLSPLDQYDKQQGN